MIFSPINYACLWAEVVTPTELSHPQQALFTSAPPEHSSVMNLPLPISKWEETKAKWYPAVVEKLGPFPVETHWMPTSVDLDLTQGSLVCFLWGPLTPCVPLSLISPSSFSIKTALKKSNCGAGQICKFQVLTKHSQEYCMTELRPNIWCEKLCVIS